MIFLAALAAQAAAMPDAARIAALLREQNQYVIDFRDRHCDTRDCPAFGEPSHPAKLPVVNQVNCRPIGETAACTFIADTKRCEASMVRDQPTVYELLPAKVYDRSGWTFATPNGDSAYPYGVDLRCTEIAKEGQLDGNRR